MIDWAKKVNKSCGEALAGETAIAGTFGQAAGTLGRQVGWGAVGGIAGVAIGEAMAKRRGEATDPGEGGLAGEIPTGKAVMAVTHQRFLVFSHGTMSGKPKDLLFECPLAAVESMELGKKRIGSTLVVRFVDGSAVDYDVVKTAKPEPFVAAFVAAKAATGPS